MGYLLLEGGAEFCGRMIEADSRALALAGGEDAAVDIIPAAAAPDNNHHRAGQNGVEWFRRIGARNVVSRLLIDKASAQKPELAQTVGLLDDWSLCSADFPLIWRSRWREPPAGTASCSVYLRGGVIGGSSAGAMVTCRKFYDPFTQKLAAGLNLMPGICYYPAP